ncbi:MAG: chorismate mutase [Promethearchaeota archaeon]
MDLAEIRETLTQIDTEILDLLSKRIKLIPAIVAEKQKLSLTSFQPEREKELFQLYGTQAQEKGLNPEFVKVIFAGIFEEMRNLQDKSL